MERKADSGSRSERWLRREERRRRERERMQKHGARMRQIYSNALRKRQEQRPASADGA